MYKGVTFSVFPGHTTNNITGEPVKLRTRREESRLCAEFGCAPYDDLRGSNERFREMMAHREDWMQDAGVSPQMFRDIQVESDKEHKRYLAVCAKRERQFKKWKRRHPDPFEEYPGK